MFAFNDRPPIGREKELRLEKLTNQRHRACFGFFNLRGERDMIEQIPELNPSSTRRSGRTMGLSQCYPTAGRMHGDQILTMESILEQMTVRWNSLRVDESASITQALEDATRLRIRAQLHHIVQIEA